MKTFMGYPRPDGSAGARNWVLILPVQRNMNMLASDIARLVEGTKVMLSPGEGGRTTHDRETMARTCVGLGMNPNVGGVLIVSIKRKFGYKELSENYFVDEIRKIGKPVRTLVLADAGGFYNALGEGVRLARELVNEVSRVHREPCDVSALCIGVKCGLSDPTSGIVGNPVVGRMFDLVVGGKGTAMFSETTEIIGAEHLLVKRTATPEVARDLLEAARITEEKAKATGEDIRKINPIPSNIAAGLTTLEEKSLGAIAKAGSTPIMGVLRYGERPTGKGLYFMDAWMSSLSLPLGYASAGAQIVLYQMGGGDLPDPYPTMPAATSGIISPLMYLTGNKHTFAKARDNMDFDSSRALGGDVTVNQLGEELFEHIIDVASGTRTKMESFRHNDPVELYLEGPSL
jgi:altronate dehydratase large subunit